MTCERTRHTGNSRPVARAEFGMWNGLALGMQLVRGRKAGRQAGKDRS